MLAANILEQRPDWKRDASCAPIPTAWARSNPSDQIEMCGDCPVSRQCLAYGFTTHSVGIVFGGIQFDDRPMGARRWMRLDNNHHRSSHA